MGFKFAAWDLFLLYPIFYKINFTRGELHRLYFVVLIFLSCVFISTVLNFGENLAFVGITLQILRNIFILNFCIIIGRKWSEPGIQQTMLFWSIFAPILFISLYFSPLQSYISEEAMGKYMRLEGFLGDANFFAMTIILLSLSVNRHRFIVFLLCFICVLLSGSRSSLALILIYFAVLFYSPRVFFASSLLGIILFSYINEKLEVLFGVFNRPIKDMSRIEFWSRAIEKFDQKYLFGYGPKSFLNDLGKFSHNDFITAYYEYGLFGLFSFALLWLTLSYFPSGFKVDKLFIMQLAYLISTFFILNLFSFWLYPHLWAVYGVMLGVAFGPKLKTVFNDGYVR